jgi:hypothetical protein
MRTDANIAGNEALRSTIGVPVVSRTSRTADRELLLALTESLSVSQRRLHRDPCGDWIIVGSRGHVLSDGVNAYIYLPFETARRWERAKRLLDFMAVVQDGDTEGVLRFDGMPTAEQAKVIRKLLGFRPRLELSEADRAALKNRFKTPSQRGGSDCFIASGGVAATIPLADLNDAETADYSVVPGVTS